MSGRARFTGVVWPLAKRIIIAGELTFENVRQSAVQMTKLRLCLRYSEHSSKNGASHDEIAARGQRSGRARGGRREPLARVVHRNASDRQAGEDGASEMNEIIDRKSTRLNSS